MLFPLLFEEEHELHIRAQGVSFTAAQSGSRAGTAVQLSASLESSKGTIEVGFGDHLLLFLNKILTMVEVSGAYIS